MNPNFKRSLEAQTIVLILAKIGHGEKIAYSALNKAIKGDVCGKQRYALSTARKALLKDGFVFDSIRKEGLTRLHPHEISLTTPRLVQRVRRAAGRHAVELGTADMSKMSGDDQKRHSSAMLHTMLIAASVTKDTARRITDEPPENLKPGFLDLETVRRVYGGN